MDIEQINPAECRFSFRGKNIAYLSARNTRNLARHVGVDSEGTKLQVFNKIVAQLEESGAKSVISDAANDTNLDESGVTADISEVAKAAKLMPLGHIDPESCPFNWQGENIASLSRTKLRIVAKQLGVDVGGVKRELYKRIVLHLKRIVLHLTQNDVIEIDGIARVTVRR